MISRGVEWPSVLGHWIWNLEVPGSNPPPYSGLKIIFERWLVVLTGQTNFSSVMFRFWPVKILKILILKNFSMKPRVQKGVVKEHIIAKSITKNMFVIRISTGSGLRLHSNQHEHWNAGLPVITTINCLETVYMTGQNDRQTQILSGQIVILAGHCPVTSRYFEPCYCYLDLFLVVPGSTPQLHHVIK